MKKILLIHGWNHLNYSRFGGTDAWANRKEFVSLLEKHFLVVKLNLPGFCGQPDPSKPWSLDDYVAFVNTVIAAEKPNIILGYSFGGAIALRWKYETGDTAISTYLVSPAILRKYETGGLSPMQKTVKKFLPKPIVSLVRDIYLVSIRKNPYYRYATRVMRTTYRNIVGLDLRQDLVSLKSPVNLIYGEQDTATPPILVSSVINNLPVTHSLYVIPGGGHDIANSHTKELFSIIFKKEGGTIEN